MKIEIYGKDETQCVFCRTAKRYLKQHDIPFEEIRLDTQEERDALYDKLDLVGPARSVPQIFVDGQHLGDSRALLTSNVAARHRAETSTVS